MLVHRAKIQKFLSHTLSLKKTDNTTTEQYNPVNCQSVNNYATSK